MSVFDTGLQGYWRCDESSGNRLDYSGNNRTLSKHFIAESVPSTTGKVGAAAINFAGASTFLETAHAPEISRTGVGATGDLTIALWVAPLVFGGSLLFKGAAGTEYELSIHSSGTVMLSVLHESTTYNVTTLSAMTLNNWHLIVAFIDSDNDLIGISIDGGAFATANTAGTPAPVSGSLRVGLNGNGASLVGAFVDEIGIWNILLTDADVDDLWNDGDGITYEDPAINVAVHLPQPSIPPPPAAVAVVGLTQPELVQAVVVQSHLVAPPVPEPDAARVRVVLPIPAAPPAAHVEVHLSDPSVESPAAVRAQANLPAPSMALDAIQVEVNLPQIGYEILVSSITSISYAAAGDITSVSFSQADIINIEYRASGF